MLPPDARAAYRKPEKQRTLAEQKMVDDYFVPLRVDPIKVKEALPEDLRKKYDEIEKQLNALNRAGAGGAAGGRRGAGGDLPAFWTVEIDKGLEKEQSYILASGEPDKPEKDKVRLDSKTPQAEYSLVYGEGRLFGIINGATFAPRADTAADFIAQQAHSIDALLRYKENESKVTSAGKDKQQGVELYVIDLVDKASRKTRYFISAKSFRVLSLEYEETRAGSATPVKYTKRFYDYRFAQGTQLPYRTVLLEDGKQIVETRILTVQYGIKMEDSLFQNPEAAASSSGP